MPRASKAKGGPLTRAVAPIISSSFLATGLSQREFGNRVGISQSQLSRYLRGELSPTIDDLDAICNGLGLSIVEVLDAADFESASRYP